MKKIVLVIMALLLLAAVPLLVSCSGDDEPVDGPMVKDAYGHWRPENCWLSECLVLPEMLDASDLFGTGGTSGLVSEKALSKDGQLGADGTGYLVCLFYGTQPEDGAITGRLRFSLVNGTQILVDGEGVTLGDISAHTTGVSATLDMSKPMDRRLTVSGDGETLQGAVVIPFTVNSPGNLYATCGLEMSGVSERVTVEDKAMATLASKTSCGVNVDSFTVRYLTQEAFSDGVYTEEDLIDAPSLNGGDNCYAVVDIAYTATDNNDGGRYFNVLSYIPGRGVLDVTVEAAPTSRVTELNTTSGIAVSASFSIPTAKEEQKAVRLLLRLLPVSGGDAEMDIFLSCSEGTALTGNTYFNGVYDTGEPTLEYTISEDGTYYTVTKILSAALRSVTIPDELGDGLPVTGFTSGLFRGNKSIQYLTIGNNMTQIEAYAFQGCTELRSVTMGTGVTFIGKGAFGDCPRLSASGLFISDLEAWCRVELENEFSTPLRYSSGFFLNGERVTELTIPYGIEHIGNYAFYTQGTGSYITKIVLPSTVKTIGDYAFGGWNRYTNVTIPEGVTSIGEGAFAGCKGLQNVSIPSTVTSIGKDAFVLCDSLVYTEQGGACYLGNSSNPYIYLAKMKNASVTSFELLATTKIVAHDTFYACGALQGITVAEGNAAFSALDGVLYSKDGTKLLQYPQNKPETAFTVPNGVVKIEPYAFYLCSKLKTLTAGESLSDIGEYAFYKSGALSAVLLGESMTVIGEHAFDGCHSLKNVTLGGTQQIGAYAFGDCDALQSIGNTENVIVFGDYAFSDCTSLRGVIVIGDSATTVGMYAFSDCEQLGQLVIGKNVVSIGRWAFSCCKALTSIYYNAAKVTDLGAEVFRYAGQSAGGIHVEIGTDVTVIPAQLFYCNTSSGSSSAGGAPYVTSVTFAEGSVCTEIGDYAFYNCRMDSIVLPSSVLRIGSGAFEKSELRAVVIPKSVTYIGSSAFSMNNAFNYEGTSAEWKQIQKEAWWNGMRDAEIVCSDTTVYEDNA